MPYDYDFTDPVVRKIFAETARDVYGVEDVFPAEYDFNDSS